MIKSNSLHMPLKDQSVQAIITSPPYWCLRKYNIQDIDINGWTGQLGLEPTPELYIEHMMLVMAECWRVLRGDGVCFINFGDTYAGSGGAGGDYNDGGRRNNQPRYKQNKPVNIKQKSLCLIPERFIIACQEAGWIIRNSIIWHKPNAMPCSAKDRFSVRHEKVFMMVKQKKYYFDLDAVRQPHALKTFTTQGIPFKKTDKVECIGKIKSHNFANSMKEHKLNPAGVNPGDCFFEKRTEKWVDVPGQRTTGFMRKGHTGYYDKEGKLLINPDGKNPGDVWIISTQPYSGWEQTSHLSHVEQDEVCDGMIHTIFPGCPVHGGFFGLVARDFCGGRVVDDLNHKAHTDNYHGLILINDSVSIEQNHAEGCVGGNLGSVHQKCSPSATVHNTQNRKTAHAQENAFLNTSFLEMISRIDDKQELLSFFVWYVNTYGNKILPDEMAAHLLDKIPYRIVDKSSLPVPSNCLCKYYHKTTKKSSHYATFPEKLVERMMLCSTKQGDVVCDPFGGSGTVGKVAIQHRRKPILLDLGYHDLQKNRMQNVQVKLF